MNVKDRFIGYAGIDTQSDPNTDLVPSTPSQMFFAGELVKELKSIGLKDASVDENGYVTATLFSNIKKKCPVVGFIAHMDTSPDFSGKHVKPRIVENYNGGDILLDPKEYIVLSPSDFPELQKYKGEDIICTSGNTLLGADDKAGVAEIISAIEYLIAHPEIEHGDVRIGFTPDEEIGKGAKYFNVKAFGAAWAYTVDGGEVGELEFENFNAASAYINIYGRNVHPGYAKHKMLNSIRIANQFVSMIPRHETPEHTEDHEGFYHLTDFKGTVEKTTLHYLIRDHDRKTFERRKKELAHLVNKLNSEYGKKIADIEVEDQYYNMREKIDPDYMFIVDMASEAMKQLSIEPKILPVRGGTDGASLSYMGLPCPNLFTGVHNMHGRYEFIPVSSMEKAMNVIIKIIELTKEV